MSESKNERFRRLAASRGDRLIREIALIGNLANRKNYEYSREEVEQLFDPIERELREVRALFDPEAPSRRRVNFKWRRQDFGFYFERAGLSEDEGAISPEEEHFEGSSAGESVVRETGQNSLDNPAAEDSTVRMEFELATMETAAIPGIEALRSHLDAAAEATQGQAGHQRMQRAAEVARQAEVDVLRISDYGTTGLRGSETDSRSPLSRLTRGSGNSEDDGLRGGSFGIGSAVGPMASELSTVFYRSRVKGVDRTVLAGFSRLATHKDEEGVKRRAGGIYMRLGADDFEYLRPAPPIEPFSERGEPGTDVFIPAFRMSEEDPNLEGIRDAAIDSFMVAIDRGRLEVTGISPFETWKLDATSLEGYARQSERFEAFYRALKDPEPDTRELRRVGEASLYVNIDENLSRTYHTMAMRGPMMHIETLKPRGLSAKYAAVLICRDPEGNRLLRKMEPPTHDKWDPGRAPDDGPAARRELFRFIRESLRDRIQQTLGPTVEIKGLERFLPSEGLVATGDEADHGVPETGGDPDSSEAATVVGAEQDQTPSVSPSRKVSVGVRRPAIAGTGGKPIHKGKDQGGKGKRKKRGGDLPGEGEEGDGTSRISVGDVRFRSWAAPTGPDGESVTVLSVTAREDISGDLKLEPLGPRGVPENAYELGIRRVERVSGSDREPVRFKGNLIMDLDLQAGETSQFELTLPAGSRYRLGVA